MTTARTYTETRQCPCCLRTHKVRRDGRIVPHGYFGHGHQCWGTDTTTNTNVKAHVEGILNRVKSIYGTWTDTEARKQYAAKAIADAEQAAARYFKVLEAR